MKTQSLIIIGGNGRSGTTAVAEILLLSDVVLGHDLNCSNNDLEIAYSFKHLKEFTKDFHTKFCLEKQSLLKPYQKQLFQQLFSTTNEQSLFFNVSIQFSWRWIRRRWFNIVKSKPDCSNAFFWED